MRLELSKKQLFDRIQILYPSLGPNKLAKFKEAAAEAFWIQIDVPKESVTVPVSEGKVRVIKAIADEKETEIIDQIGEDFLDFFVKNTKHFWNQPKNKKWFKKVWNFDYLVPPPPVQVVPEVTESY